MQTISRLVPKPMTCDVLISCAEDTLANFTSMLSKSLDLRGFPAKVVVDHRELNKEEIEGFRVIIVVLSDHYPTCPFRLDKLEEIVNEFGSREDRRVFPVFIDMKVSDVRYQEGIYAVALAVYKHFVEPERLQKWTEVLNKLADIVGWPLNRSQKSEYQRIEDIIQEVSKHVACSVGLHRRVEKVNALLDSRPENGVQWIVIHGEAGIGKTTVASGVFHSNGGSRIPYHYLLEEVGECLRNHGLVGLIKMLFSKMGDKDIKFENLSEGMSILEQKVKDKRLFLVLEDILDKEQLQDIVNVTNCFSSSSKVIVTIEDDCFLQCPEVEVKSYKVEMFNDEEAFELLNLKAFNSKNMKSKYVGIILQAKDVASGVPFNLEMIGSSFHGKSAEECSHILDQYKKIQNDKKQRIVQMSFDALEEDSKKMLKYIALDLNKQKLAMVEDKLCRTFGVYAKDSIKELLDKALIKINEHGLVTMHHLKLNVVKYNTRLQDQFQQCPSQLSLENTEYDMQEIQPASNDGTKIFDPMEFEHQLFCPNFSSSSSQILRDVP